MDITWKKPDELIPYEANAKKHPAAQVEHIANSIKNFGWQQPIVVDKDNVVIIGHGRLMAAKELMLDKVPVVCADNLTPEQVNALRLADNKTNESEWDFSLLEMELAALDINGIDMTQFGFEAPGELFDFMNNDAFADKNNNPDTFTMSFEFDIADKDDLTDYIKKNGKTGIVDAILEVVKGAELQ